MSSVIDTQSIALPAADMAGCRLVILGNHRDTDHLIDFDRSRVVNASSGGADATAHKEKLGD